MSQKFNSPAVNTSSAPPDFPSGKTLRYAYFRPATAADLSANSAREYSRMKYGDPEATHSIAARLTDLLVNSPDFMAEISPGRPLLLASSAFGSIPTAAYALALEMKVLLEQEGLEVLMIKLKRVGGFARTNYGALDFEGRMKALNARKISISKKDRELLRGGTLLVVDDLRSTGAHERVLEEVLRSGTEAGTIAFAYWIAFAAGLKRENPMQEEAINHSNISRLEDLLPFFADSSTLPYLNARVLKFVLSGGLDRQGDREAFFRALPVVTSLRIYEAAMSRDGYRSQGKFREGIRILEKWLTECGALAQSVSKQQSGRGGSATTLHRVRLDQEGRFVCADSGRDLSAEIARYSRFKFGDVEEIRYFGRQLADQMISETEAGGPLADIFTRAREHSEYIYLQAPGYRNVVSASNYLLREVAARVNVWLSLRGLPTMIAKPLTRLASGRANYAELPANERPGDRKSTQSLLPADEYREHPIHVIFLDDVEVSGATAGRARKRSLQAGARSFHEVFAFQVDRKQAQKMAGIEHEMNQFQVKGGLDAEVASILSHPDYQPVQRMLRMLLHPRNQAQLPAFARQEIPANNLMRIYLGAMSNDYLRINPGDDPADKGWGEYGPSLMQLREVMQEEGMLDENGLPV